MEKSTLACRTLSFDLCYFQSASPWRSRQAALPSQNGLGVIRTSGLLHRTGTGTGTPFERPAAFAGRRVDELSAQELADLMKKRQQEAFDRAPFLGGDPEGKIGNSAEFRDIYEVTRGSRPWFVTDPADGKIPAVLPSRVSRVQDAGRSGSFGGGPIQRSGGFHSLGALHHARPARLDAARRVWQLISDRAGPGFVAIRYEMVHETRVIPSIRPSLGQNCAVRHRKRAWTLGRRHTRRRDDQLQAAQHVSQCRRRHPSVGRALPADVSRPGVEWSVTVEDPPTWAKPWTFSCRSPETTTRRSSSTNATREITRSSTS